jgi:hypothetical protein
MTEPAAPGTSHIDMIVFGPPSHEQILHDHSHPPGQDPDAGVSHWHQHYHPGGVAGGSTHFHQHFHPAPENAEAA